MGRAAAGLPVWMVQDRVAHTGSLFREVGFEEQVGHEGGVDVSVVQVPFEPA